MQSWVRGGVSLKSLFEAVTVRNAEAFGIKDTHGTIEQGKFADLLLLQENPLQGVSSYDSIDLVILNGKQIPRASLSARFKGELK